MRKINKNSRRGIVNLFADFILTRIDKKENSIIQVTDCGPFVVINGQTTSNIQLDIQKITSQEFLFSVTTGVRSITLGIIGSIVSISTDLSLLIIMFSGLIIVDPVVALISFVIFSSSLFSFKKVL